MKTLRLAVASLFFCLIAAAQTSTPCDNQSTVQFYGGGILHNNFVIHPIFYGDAAADTKSLLLDFLTNLPNHGIWAIPSHYCDDSGNYVPSGSGNITLDTALSVAGFGYGYSLTHANIQGIVQDAINNGMTASANDVYAVIAHGVSNTGGYHSAFSNGYPQYADTVISGTLLHILYVSLPTGSTTTPNGNYSADYGASLLLHELAEIVTDPGVTSSCCGWETGYPSYLEIADMCQVYSAPYTAPNGAGFTIQMASEYATAGDPYSSGYSGYRDWNVQPLLRNTAAANCGWSNP